LGVTACGLRIGLGVDGAGATEGFAASTGGTVCPNGASWCALVGGGVTGRGAATLTGGAVVGGGAASALSWGGAAVGVVVGGGAASALSWGGAAVGVVVGAAVAAGGVGPFAAGRDGAPTPLTAELTGDFLRIGATVGDVASVRGPPCDGAVGEGMVAALGAVGAGAVVDGAAASPPTEGAGTFGPEPLGDFRWAAAGP